MRTLSLKVRVKETAETGKKRGGKKTKEEASLSKPTLCRSKEDGNKKSGGRGERLEFLEIHSFFVILGEREGEGVRKKKENEKEKKGKKDNYRPALPRQLIQ